MNRSILMLWALLSVIPTLWAGEVQLLNTFPYDAKAFQYVLSWGDDGLSGGPQGIQFLNIDEMFILWSRSGVMWDSSIIYRLADFSVIQEISVSHGTTFTVSPRGWAVGNISRGSSIDFTTDRGAPYRFVRFNIPQSFDIPEQSGLYLTNNNYFIRGLRSKLSSWELEPSGNVRYRNEAETEAWLAKEGARLGYRLLDNIPYFGENAIYHRSYFSSFKTLQVRGSWLTKPSDPFPSEAALIQSGYWLLGYDAKGLEYKVLEKNAGYKNTDPLIGSSEHHYMIVDPWSRRVAYRTLPAGQWLYLMAPYKTAYDEGVRRMGGYIQGIHPQGDIYFFSANKAAGAFDLKRFTNDWWAELGVDKKVIGRILGNHIPLYAQPNATSSIVAYNYENEYVWIQEESSALTTYEGRPSPWVKVQKLSGAVGWMPREPIVVPD